MVVEKGPFPLFLFSSLTRLSPSTSPTRRASRSPERSSARPDGAILAMNVIEEIHRLLPNTHLVMHGSSSVPQELQDAGGWPVHGNVLEMLREELEGRLRTGPVAFRLLLQLAEAGDPTDDVTALWPEGRPLIELGRLEVTGISPTSVADERRFVDLAKEAAAMFLRD